MGYPEDGTGACAGGLIGDGNWDRYAYFKSNSAAYPTVTTPAALNTFLTNTFGTTTPTRYQVYLWEMTNSGSRLLPQTSGSLAAHSHAGSIRSGCMGS